MNMWDNEESTWNSAPVRQRRLTEKQMAFVNNIVAGMTQADAFAKAYDHEDWDRRMLAVEGSRVYNKPHVQEEIQKRLEIARKKEMTHITWEREQSAMTLQNLIATAYEEISVTKKLADYYEAKGEMEKSMKIRQKQLTVTRVQAIVSSVQELNKMYGHHAKEGSNVKQEVPITFINANSLPE